MLSEGQPTTVAVRNPVHLLGSKEEVGVTDRIHDDHNLLNLLHLETLIEEPRQIHSERIEG